MKGKLLFFKESASHSHPIPSIIFSYHQKQPHRGKKDRARDGFLLCPPALLSRSLPSSFLGILIGGQSNRTLVDTLIHPWSFSSSLNMEV